MPGGHGSGCLSGGLWQWGMFCLITISTWTSCCNIKESASTFQIHSYQSIYTTYTSPLPYNKLSNLKTYKTLEIILGKPMLLPQKYSKSCWKRSIIERKPLTNGKEGQ